MARKGQKFQNISNEIRNQVLKEYIENNKGQSEISREYGIKLGTVLTIIYKYQKLGYVNKDKRGKFIEGNFDYKERYEILKKFQAFLKQQQEKK